MAEGFTTPIAEVDLKVGGRYRLGMKAPGDNPLLIVGGVYREIVHPERLVFTWQWESTNPHEGQVSGSSRSERAASCERSVE